MAGKMVYFFGRGQTEGNAQMKNLLGGKGANLAEMANMGIPVPPGFTITTEVCISYYHNNQEWPEGLEDEIRANMAKLEEAMGQQFGSTDNPLLLSVRSGARVSMPGMMDTVLNLGLNDATIEGLIARSQNERFAYDSYRRFIQMYSDVVLGIDHDIFEETLATMKEDRGATQDTDLTASDLKELVSKYKQIVQSRLGKPFPEDVWEQLYGSINAVFRSWNNPRAVKYRALNNIPGDWGTAVNVQTMVFGNLGETSGTGVAFTRDPGTGEKRFFGEYLMNAQGEDVVAGIRTPQPIKTLAEAMPDVYNQLVEIYQKLEDHYRDMQDLEFTIQEGNLFLLQTRNGKRTAQAAVRIAVEMVKEGLITEKEALLRVSPAQLDQLLHPMLDPKAQVKPIAKGLPASPGAAVGKVVFTAEDAEKWAANGEKVILVRTETSPEDIGGMHVAEGILTARGGMTSHAAVVARGMGKCCVAGCSAIKVDHAERCFYVEEKVIREGTWLTLNGSTGEVIVGQVPLIQPELSGDFGQLMEWADKYRKLGVWANADTPGDASAAIQFGAEGIGLCRTEHMFFAEDRIKAVREMILADDTESRAKALQKLEPIQRGDFKDIFRVMKDLPVTIRLLDPPLHEFLPNDPQIVADLAESLGKTESAIRRKVESLHELNPMLGHRGCRLGITFEEIYEMQARAILSAAAELQTEGIDVRPEIMIPLIGTKAEFEFLREMILRVSVEVKTKYNVELNFTIGTMIEIPRATLIADQIAETAEFFSFGTNDLTQMILGYSRDDSGSFLPAYLEKGILPADPFSTIDQEGVGQLVRLGVERGRQANPGLKLGVCGEHGGDPESITFFHAVGLDYVSCSPYRVPVARLAAAQAAIQAQ